MDKNVVYKKYLYFLWSNWSTQELKKLIRQKAQTNKKYLEQNDTFIT